MRPPRLATPPTAPPGAPAPSPAVAPPPGAPRFALFDGLRAVAALLIVSYHTSGISGWMDGRTVGDVILLAGNQAMLLFFVISGFLLYRPFVAARAAGRPQPPAGRYLRRRALRIVPAYWVALTLLAIYPGVIGPFSHDWWRYYLFLQLYWERTLGNGIPPAWSLCVEVTFYISLPLWAHVMRRLPAGRSWLRTELWGLGVVALGGAVVQLLAARQAISYTWANALPGQATWFALGMALAVASVAVQRGEGLGRLERAVARRPGSCWLVAAIALALLVVVVDPGGLFGLIMTLREPQPAWRTALTIVLTGIITGLLVAPAVFGERAGGLPRRTLAWTPLAAIGVVSYGIYLWHLTAAEWIGTRTDGHFSAGGLDLVARAGSLATPVLYAATIAVSFVLALISYRVVELPFLRRKG